MAWPRVGQGGRSGTSAIQTAPPWMKPTKTVDEQNNEQGTYKIEMNYYDANMSTMKIIEMTSLYSSPFLGSRRQFWRNQKRQQRLQEERPRSRSTCATRSGSRGSRRIKEIAMRLRTAPFTTARGCQEWPRQPQQRRRKYRQHRRA